MNPTGVALKTIRLTTIINIKDNLRHSTIKMTWKSKDTTSFDMEVISSCLKMAYIQVCHKQIALRITITEE